MRNPSSVVRRATRRLRHPSPALVVAGVALFMSLGGAGYAATRSLVHTSNIHNWAVTSSKIANNAVTFRKIKPSSVGVRRIVKNQVQLRLQNVCAAGQAMTAVDVNGMVTCATTAPAETNSAAPPVVPVGSATAGVASLSLGAGPGYEVQANPYITVIPSTSPSAVDQHVIVTCTLFGGTAEAQRSVSVDLPSMSGTPKPQVQTESIPLVVMAPSSAIATNAAVTCVRSVTDTSGSNVGKAAANPAGVTAQGQIYATQVASATTGAAATAAPPTPTVTPEP